MRDQRNRSLTGIHTLFIVSGLLAAATAGAQPRIAFDGDRIEVSGVTPGGPVVAFGAGQARPGWLPGFRWSREILHDHDGDGVVHWKPATPLPGGFAWVAVDLTSGAHSSASLSETPVQAFSKAALAASAGAPEMILRAGTRLPTLLAALLVRPGQGAWALLSPDGAATDLDGGEDGSQRLRLAECAALAQAPAVDVFEAGDVLVVIEMRTLTIGVWQLGKGEE